MALYHVYNQTVADGTATSVVRPSDWNSAHSQVMTIAGNTAGASTVSGTNVVFQGGNNVTLSVNQAAGVGTIVVSGPNVSQYLTTAAQSNHSHNFATTTTNGASIVVGTANSAGATIGVPAFLTTAQPVGAYLTTARASNDAIGLNSGLTANGVSMTANSSGLSLNFPAFLTTAAQSNHSHNFATTTTNGSQIVVGTTNSAGATVGVPPFITTYVAQTTQTQPAGNIAGVGTTFGGTNVSATMGFNSNGLALSLSAPTPGGGGAINVSAGTTSGNLQTVQFDNANGVTFGLNGSTVTASVNAGGGAAESNFMPHANALWAAAQVGQNSIQVQPMCGAPYVTYDRLAYAVQFTQATNSTMTVSATIHMGVYSKNGSTLSQITSHSGSFSINGSGTASSSANSGPRWATMTFNAGGSISGDVWIAFKSSTATAGVNATLSNIVASRINSSWSGYIGVGTANSAQSLPGMGYYSATSSALPNSMAFSHITGVSSTAQRPQVFFLTNGALPI